jgi:hypothetical protein
MSIVIRPLREDDLKDARRIMSRAFGTFIGLPEPERFAADRDYIRTTSTARWRATGHQRAASTLRAARRDPPGLHTDSHLLAS